MCPNVDRCMHLNLTMHPWYWSPSIRIQCRNYVIDWNRHCFFADLMLKKVTSLLSLIFWVSIFLRCLCDCELKMINYQFYVKKNSAEKKLFFFTIIVLTLHKHYKQQQHRCVWNVTINTKSQHCQLKYVATRWIKNLHASAYLMTWIGKECFILYACIQTDWKEEHNENVNADDWCLGSVKST